MLRCCLLARCDALLGPPQPPRSTRAPKIENRPTIFSSWTPCQRLESFLTAQNGSQTAQDCTTTPPDGPSEARDGPRSRHAGPMTIPSRPNRAPSDPGRPPRRPGGRPGGSPGKHKSMIFRRFLSFRAKNSSEKERKRNVCVPFAFLVIFVVAFLSRSFSKNRERVPAAFLNFRTRSGTRSFVNAFTNALQILHD